jgi:hypothetical protein
MNMSPACKFQKLVETWRLCKYFTCKGHLIWVCSPEIWCGVRSSKDTQNFLRLHEIYV